MNPEAGHQLRFAGGYFGLDGEVALVTGASSGLGRHFAEVLGRAGATVYLAARRKDRLAELADAMKQAGSRAIAVEMDVTDRASIETGFTRLESEAGPATILVNNAGIVTSAKFLEASDTDTDRVFDTNVRAVWQIAQRAAQGMVRAGKGGAIVNIASILGLSVSPGVASYCVSKAAVIQLTRAMALELARDDIRVNAIAPGYFPSEITNAYLESDDGKSMVNGIPMRRIGRLEDLDDVLLLLTSQRGAYITGSVIAVDGGHLLVGGD